MASILERYAKHIKGVLSCFDRVVITGTLPGVCYAKGMTQYLNAKGIRIFDYARFAEPLRERIRANAERLAAQAGIAIQFIAKAHIRKEAVVARIVAERGPAPGLVAVLSAMEACQSYKPWHDKPSGRTFLRPDSGKCLHYYFYFIDECLGLCYLRVPTWAPFRLQCYFNGHHWLASRLAAQGIDYRLQDNAFLDVADFGRAQALADEFSVKKLHGALDRFAQWYCPILSEFATGYHWSLMQAEYATDIVFDSAAALGPLYEAISRGAILAVKAEQVARFLGRPLDRRFAQELSSRFCTRIEGTCVKHHMGKAAIKMYDKFGLVLRIEITVNDVSFFKHHRRVEHRDRHASFALAALKKSIYSLTDLRQLLAAANQRYLAFVSELSDPSPGQAALEHLAEPTLIRSAQDQGRDVSKRRIRKPRWSTEGDSRQARRAPQASRTTRGEAGTQGRHARAQGERRGASPVSRTLDTPMKTRDAPVDVGPLSGSLADQGRAVLTAITDRRLSPDEAATLMQAVAAQARIIEVDDLEKRVQRLEKAEGGPS